MASRYLEGAADAEDTVVGLLGRQALEGELDYVVLLGENVIGPTEQAASAHRSNSEKAASNWAAVSRADWRAGRACVPQTELPVASGVAVPLGERRHPALQPRALEDEGCERRRRHGGRVRFGSGAGAAGGGGGSMGGASCRW